MGDIRDTVKKGAERFGINVVDVRIKRADLVPENSDAVFRSMQAERQLRAAKIRAEGVQESQSINSKADRDVIVVKAQAQQQAEQIRGEGDAERNQIFADAYGGDPEFFAFYRSMQAYERRSRATRRAILSPKSDFFRYFSNPVPAASARRRRLPPSKSAPLPPPRRLCRFADTIAGQASFRRRQARPSRREDAMRFDLARKPTSRARRAALAAVAAIALVRPGPRRFERARPRPGQADQPRRPGRQRRRRGGQHLGDPDGRGQERAGRSRPAQGHAVRRHVRAVLQEPRLQRRAARRTRRRRSARASSSIRAGSSSPTTTSSATPTTSSSSSPTAAS